MMRLRRARELSGLPLAQAADLLGITVSELSSLETSSVDPTDDQLHAMAVRYHVSLAWLRGADPVVPEPFRKMVNASDISTRDREALLEFAGMLSLMPAAPPAAERLAAIAAKRDPVAEDPMLGHTAKVRYVMAQGQTRNHHCHWTGCNKQVPPAMWGCKKHWLRLPKVLRDRIWAAYRPGQEIEMTPSVAYLQAADDVQRWIRDHGEEARFTASSAGNNQGTLPMDDEGHE